MKTFIVIFIVTAGIVALVWWIFRRWSKEEEQPNPPAPRPSRSHTLRHDGRAERYPPRRVERESYSGLDRRRNRQEEGSSDDGFLTGVLVGQSLQGLGSAPREEPVHHHPVALPDPTPADIPGTSHFETGGGFGGDSGFSSGGSDFGGSSDSGSSGGDSGGGSSD